MSSLDILSPEQYRNLLSLPEEDKKIFLKDLIQDKSKIIQLTKQYPLEIDYKSKLELRSSFRTVFYGPDSVEFLITVLKIYLQ